DALQRSDEAIRVYQSILDRPLKELASGAGGEGEAWAKELVADCWYRSGICHEHLKQPERAVECFATHLSLRDRGWGSTYTRAEVSGRLVREHRELHLP